ncbi:hypothetical protein SAY86_008333 [Trapa natans]|uniref:pectinesterase n=1 Tax=Trapa natans TaxID=22666 RepID=A0AAN7KH05_TRANT|nr:hypothetical protein SAY86_008333 [Trapa natans]
MDDTRRGNLIFFSNLFLFSSLGHASAVVVGRTAALQTGDIAPIHHGDLHEEIARSHCEGTLYPELCVSTVAAFPDLASKSLPQVIAAAINLTSGEVHAADDNCTRLEQNWLKQLAPLDRRALDDCRELFQETVDEFNGALSDLSGTSSSSKHIHDLQTLLSGAMTNQYTCLDGFAYSESNATVRKRIEKRLLKISQHVSNSLAMLKKIPGANDTRSEVLPEYGRLRKGFPSWVSRKDRRLLQTSTGGIKYNLVVAKDGSGNFNNIADAVAAAPNSNTARVFLNVGIGRFVIYIKAGTYFENIEVDSKKTNLMFVGDGIGKTLVKGNRNVVDGWTTFRSATVGTYCGTARNCMTYIRNRYAFGVCRWEDVWSLQMASGCA